MTRLELKVRCYTMAHHLKWYTKEQRHNANNYFDLAAKYLYPDNSINYMDARYRFIGELRYVISN